jgi:protein PsiE
MQKELRKTSALDQRMKKTSNVIGNFLVDGFHYLALFAIGASIVWSAAFAFIEMTAKSHAGIEDILLLFIYLELGAIVGIYFKTNRMPVRFLIYVAVTALTRMLLGKIQMNHEPDNGIILIAGAILLLALATLVFRFGSHTYPSPKLNDPSGP